MEFSNVINCFCCYVIKSAGETAKKVLLWVIRNLLLIEIHLSQIRILVNKREKACAVCPYFYLDLIVSICSFMVPLINRLMSKRWKYVTLGTKIFSTFLTQTHTALTNWLSRNPKVHYRPYISPPLVPFFSKSYPISRITTHLPQIHFNIILPSTSRPRFKIPSNVKRRIQCV